MITPTNKFFNQQWYLTLIQVEDAWQALNGGVNMVNGGAAEIAFGRPEITISVIDLGIESKRNAGGVLNATHKAFQGTLTDGGRKIEDFVHIFNRASFLLDETIFGVHGVNAASILSAKAEANGYNGEGVVGVAPNCKLVSVAQNDSAFAALVPLEGLVLEGIDKATRDDFSFMQIVKDIYNLTDNVASNSRIAKRDNPNRRARLEAIISQASDIISMSLLSPPSSTPAGVVDPANTLIESTSKVFLDSLFFWGREGRGTLVFVGSGNEGVQLEMPPNPGQFRNEILASNKAIAVGATSVADNYDNITGAPAPVEVFSSYSNFGQRLDITAPAGGGTTPGYGDRLSYAATVRGGGQLYADSPLVMNITNRISNTELELPNVNGVFVGQYLTAGDPATLEFDVSLIRTVNRVNNRVTITPLTKTAGIAINGTPTSIAPLYTTMSAAGTGTNVIVVESLRGAYMNAEVFVGTLGGAGTATRYTISNINTATRELTLLNIGGGAAPVFNNAIGTPVVFDTKITNITAASTTVTGTILTIKSLTLASTEGLFSGERFVIYNVGGVYANDGIIATVDSASNTITFQVTLTRTYPAGTAMAPIIGGLINELRTVGYGDISNAFAGTSSATPVVAGVAALVLSANPLLNFLEVRDILFGSADMIDAAHPDWAMRDGRDFNPHYGYGRINALGAVQAAMAYNLAERSMSIRDNIGGGDINSPDIWVRPAVDPPVVTTYQQDGAVHHLEPDLSVAQKIYVRVSNTGNALPSIRGVTVRCLIAFNDADQGIDYPFPSRWHHQIRPDGRNIILAGIKEITTEILPNVGVVAGNAATWNETIVEVDWDPSLGFVDWKKMNPKGYDPYLLVHISPFDGPAAGVSLIDAGQNKQLTFKPIAPLFVRFTRDTEVALFDPSTSIIVSFDAGTVSFPFYVYVHNVLQANLVNTYIKATVDFVDPVIPNEVIRFRDEGASWGYDPNGVPDWVAIQTPTITNTHIANYRKLSFECGLFVSKAHDTVTIEVIDNSTGVEVVRDTQIFDVRLPAAIPNSELSQALLQVVHSFTEFTNLVQAPANAYGPVVGSEDSQYRVCSMFTSASATENAYAVVGGSAFIQEIPGGNLVNLILKPDEQPVVNGIYVKYFVYRGLRRSSFLVAGAAGNVLAEANVVENDLLARMWQVKNEWNQQQTDIGAAQVPVVVHVNEPLVREDLGLANVPADQLPNDYPLDQVFLEHTFQPIIEGWELGLFEAGGSFGFEVILDYPGHVPTLGDVRTLDHIIAVPAPAPLPVIANTMTGFSQAFARERILGYMDPAAFYGMFYNFKIKNHVGTAVNLIDNMDIKNLIIDRFATNENIYIDIRNDFGNSINLYDDYKVGDNPVAITLNGAPADYEHFSWPILMVNAAGLANLELTLPIGNNVNPILYLVSGKYNGDTNKFKILGTAAGVTDAFQLEVPIKDAVVYPGYFKINYNKRYPNINAIADPLSSVVMNKRSPYDNIFSLNLIPAEDNGMGTVWNSLSDQRYLGVTSMDAAPNNFDFNVRVGRAKDTIGETVYAFTTRPMERNGLDDTNFSLYPIGIENGKKSDVPTMLHYLRTLTDLVTSIDVVQDAVNFPMIDFININDIPAASPLNESMDNYFSISYHNDEALILQNTMAAFVADYPIYLVFRDLQFDGGVVRHFRIALQGVTRNAADNTYRTEIIDPATVIRCYASGNNTSYFTDAYVKAYAAI